jgi:LPS-assembly protein
MMLPHKQLVLAFGLLGLCMVAPHAQDMPFDLQAASVSYATSPTRVVAEGAVRISSTEGVVQADRLTYLPDTDQLTASGNVVLTEPTGNTLLLDELTLADRLKTGTLQQLRLRVPQLGQVATARSGLISGSTYTMNQITYSPCKTCEGEAKPWQMRADTMTFDQTEGEVTYRNATMDVYGMPVLYLPWFRHPLGPRKAKSGVLMPQIGRSTTLGEQITLAGYINSPLENADYTIRSRSMSERGTQLQLERRQRLAQLDSEVKVSYLNDTGTSKVRSHVQGEAEYVVQPGRRVGLTGEMASDDTYLTQFFNRTDPYLTSTAYAEDASENPAGGHYLGASMTRFQDLVTTRDPANTAQVMPHLQYAQTWQLDQVDNDFLNALGGQTNLSADVLSLSRASGIRSRRIVTEGTYTKPWLLSDGSKLTLNTQLRADLYNVDGQSTGSGTNGTVSRWLPEVSGKWEKPFISPGGEHTITPMVLTAFSPRGGNLNNRVPNEDSVAYELDTTNLFETNRFAGLDRVETGPRLIYGIDNRWGTADLTKWRVFVGQSLRRFDDSSLPVDGGAATNVSDYVGQLEANPVDWFGLNSNFRLDNATFIARRLDNSLRLGRTDEAHIIATHSYLDNGPANLATEAELPLTDTVTALGRTRHDLQNDRLLLGEVGMRWMRDCYEVELTARRRGFQVGDVQPSTDYLLNLKLLTFGDES